MSAHPLLTRLCGAILVFALMSFKLNTAPASEGKWNCGAFTCKLNDFTTLEKSCLGDLHFRSNQSLESTCTAGFFPTGTRWKVVGKSLRLSDSDGKEFVQFDIQSLNERELVLLRSEKVYYFKREN